MWHLSHIVHNKRNLAPTLTLLNLKDNISDISFAQQLHKDTERMILLIFVLVQVWDLRMSGMVMDLGKKKEVAECFA